MADTAATRKNGLHRAMARFCLSSANFSIAHSSAVLRRATIGRQQAAGKRPWPLPLAADVWVAGERRLSLWL